MNVTCDKTEPEPLRVLVVDDGLVHQRLAYRILTQQGCEVTVTSDGRQALSLLESGDFDVVLMDVDMPVMDGLTATTLIRERDRVMGRRTPVVAVSATADGRHCLAVGVDAFLRKPLRPDSLFETLQQVL